MNEERATLISNSVKTIAAFLAALGINNWSAAADVMTFIAGAAAAAYNGTLLVGWWWRKFWRPKVVGMGWLKPPPPAPAQAPGPLVDTDLGDLR